MLVVRLWNPTLDGVKARDAEKLLFPYRSEDREGLFSLGRWVGRRS